MNREISLLQKISSNTLKKEITDLQGSISLRDT